MSRTVELTVDDTAVLHRVIPMPPDGSCLFHSIAFSMFNSIDIEQNNRLRATIVEYVCVKWEVLGVYTCAQNGNPYESEEEYRASMLYSTTYGAVSELIAAGDLYNIKIEVYQEGILRGSFGEVGHPTMRLLFSGNLSAGHYDVCVPIEQVNTSTPDRLEQNNALNENSLYRKGRPPKRKQGRPKTSDKSRKEQRREANQRYKNAHPDVVKDTQKRYADKHPEVHQKAAERDTAKQIFLSEIPTRTS